MKSTPLYWPDNFNRTDEDKRRSVKFIGVGSFKQLSDKIRSALARFGVQRNTIVISSNHGAHYNGDPGVAVYWEVDGKHCALAADHTTSIELNLNALCTILHAVELQMNFGGKNLSEAFVRAFRSDTCAAASGWWTVLEVEPNATDEEVKEAYRRAAMRAHPDRGGSDEKMRVVQEAYDKAMKGRA